MIIWIFLESVLCLGTEHSFLGQRERPRQRRVPRAHTRVQLFVRAGKGVTLSHTTREKKTFALIKT